MPNFIYHVLRAEIFNRNERNESVVQSITIQDCIYENYATYNRVIFVLFEITCRAVTRYMLAIRFTDVSNEPSDLES